MKGVVVKVTNEGLVVKPVKGKQVIAVESLVPVRIGDKVEMKHYDVPVVGRSLVIIAKEA